MGNWNNDKTAYISTEDEVKNFKEGADRLRQITKYDRENGCVSSPLVCAYCGKPVWTIQKSVFENGRYDLKVAYENGAEGLRDGFTRRCKITGTKKGWLNGRYGLQTLGKTFCLDPVFGVSYCRDSYFQKNNILTNEAKIRADEEKKAAEERAEKEKKWAETSDLINGIFYSKDHLAVNGAQQNIQDAKILDGVTTIKLKAFYECKNLRSIQIPETVSNIEAWAFSDCSSLSAEVKLPSGLTKISKGLFYDTPISNITIPKKVTEIGQFAFCATKLRGLVLPENVTKIPKDMCANTGNLKYVAMSSKVSEVEEGAFSGCDGVYKTVRKIFGGTYHKTTFIVYMIGGKLSSAVKDLLIKGYFAGVKNPNLRRTRKVKFIEIKAPTYDEGVEVALKKQSKMRKAKASKPKPKIYYTITRFLKNNWKKILIVLIILVIIKKFFLK